MVALFGWWKKKSEAAPPLIAGPVGPRVKTYSAASGYVYQYAFIGQRAFAHETEYVFSVSYDRRTQHRISVWVGETAVAPWERAQGRALSTSERYAIAKIALRNAFDERERPEAIHLRIAPGAEEVQAILDSLDV